MCMYYVKYNVISQYALQANNNYIINYNYYKIRYQY